MYVFGTEMSDTFLHKLLHRFGFQLIDESGTQESRARRNIDAAGLERGTA